MYDYFNLVQLYEKSKKEINKLKCKNYDLQQENKQLKEQLGKLSKLDDTDFWLEYNRDVWKIQNENEKLKCKNYDLQQENKQLQARIDKAIEKLTLLIDIGFDYDGLNKIESLKSLIDELVSYARESRKILKGDK